MKFEEEQLGLYTDFYQLSMAQGYWESERGNQQVTFDYFYRTNPFNGGFLVFAGLETLLESIKNYTFSNSDIEYLKIQGLSDPFLGFLKNFRFTGTIQSVKEGEIVFPGVPLIQIQGTIIEAQLIESMLLNIVNFQSMVATKSFRVSLAAKGKPFSDFGLRRAQGFGALHASRAATIGGASSSSNVLAGKLFDIPVSGTMAHSWILSFDNEIEAFQTYAKIHPKNAIFLVDTYNTLKSGVQNAIRVAKEMEERGEKAIGIRLDSGDLAYLSRKARKMMDEVGLNYMKIIASNQLNEHVIRSLNDQDAALDAYGVGTELITGKPDAAIDGVYKLAECEGVPKMKISENIEKVTLPGRKTPYRYLDSDGCFYRDGILLSAENPQEVTVLHHPYDDRKKTSLDGLTCEKLLQTVMKNGKRTIPESTPAEANKYLVARSKCLAKEHKRFISPHLYKVGFSEALKTLRNNLFDKNTNYNE